MVCASVEKSTWRIRIYYWVTSERRKKKSTENIFIYIYIRWTLVIVQIENRESFSEMKKTWDDTKYCTIFSYVHFIQIVYIWLYPLLIKRKLSHSFSQFFFAYLRCLQIVQILGLITLKISSDELDFSAVAQMSSGIWRTISWSRLPIAMSILNAQGSQMLILCLGFAISSNDLGCSTHIQVLYKLLQQNFFQFRISQWILCFSFFNFSTDTFCEWHGYKRPSSACPHILFFSPRLYLYLFMFHV